LFRVSTFDLANLPRTQEGKVHFAQDFFGREAFLTVSGQLNVEAYCLGLTKVYTFHAENSNTSRHLGEFRMIELEIVFTGLSDNAALAEAPLKYSFAALLKEEAGYRDELPEGHQGVLHVGERPDARDGRAGAGDRRLPARGGGSRCWTAIGRARRLTTAR
jgi:aspartyl/asparaginyl-tRNA synthetase